MEPPEDFKLLESNRPEVVEGAKKRFHELFNSTKESWLLNGLVDFFVATGSLRCADVIVCVREPHDSYFFNKMLESLRNTPSSRLSVLTLLSHVVYRQPTWLFKITQHNLFKELLKILKTETDIVILMSALLTLIVLLPMIPAYVGSTLQDIFEVFSRLAAWNANNTSKLPDDQLVHLQVSLHSLFHRLYGMYPCNFLSFLRQQYGARENLAIFSHTIKPMLETVKMHPLLVTTSKETETTTTRWKSMEHHDVVVECARLCVDSKDDNVTPSVSGFRARSESELRRIFEKAGYHDLKSADNDQIEFKDLWSPSILGSSGVTPPVSASLEPSAPSSIPHTPIQQVLMPVLSPKPKTFVVSSSLSHQVGTSPPEAAIEATPETTPVKDPRLYISTRAPPVNSSVVRALNQMGAPKWSSSTSTPSTSQPSSPMKKEVSPFGYPEPGGSELRYVHRKVQSLVLDRLNVQRGSVNGVKIDDAPEGCHDDQEDQEVLEISQQGELRISSNQSTGGSRQCDSVLQDFHPPHGEDLEPCEQESGSPCPSGGLHMPNSRSMLHFRQRLRYYSQCGNDLSFSPTVSSKLEEIKNGDTLMMPTIVRRAKSCPEIKKERPLSIGPDSGDETLDKTLEFEHTESKSTQTGPTDLPPPQPYEHMFLALFPPITEPESSSVPRSASPITVLDKYLDRASFQRVEETSPKPSVSVLESELRTARDQLVLLHLQLKFERHRRDIHDERNRRLLGKSRHNRSLEEHNSALRDQLSLLMSDIDILHEQIVNNKEDFIMREKNLMEEVNFWQERCTNIEKESRELKSDYERVKLDLAQVNKHSADTAKMLQQVEAQLFSVGKELKEATAQATAGEALKLQVAYLHKELVVMGEQNARTRDLLGKVSARSGKPNQICHDSYVEQVRGLTGQLDAKTTSCEAYRTRVVELESAVARRDSLIADQKRTLKAVKEECREELEAVETKYRSQLATNRKLESQILDLLSKLETVGRRSRRNVSAAQDCLSLAERGGLNSPLSLSLSSSEGLSLSSIPASDSTLARDLQSVVDTSEASCIPELAEFEDLPGSHD